MFRLQPVKGLVGIGVQRRDGHQPGQVEIGRLLDLGAHLVDGPRPGNVHTAAGLVAVEADLDVDPHRVGAAPFGQRRRHPRSRAVTSWVLSTECAVWAQQATDRALFRWI